MPKTITQVNTADTYTEQGGANINSAYQSKGGWCTMSAQVMAQIQHSSAPDQSQGQEQWSDEFVLPAGAHYLQPGIIGIRFRSFTTGVPVAVSAAIFYRDEQAIQLGGSGISTPSSSVASLNFQRNDLAVATEPTADFMDGANALTWSVVDDAPNTRVRITPAFTNPAFFPGNVFAPSTFTSAVGSPTGAGINSGGVLQVSRTGINAIVFSVTQSGDTTDWRFKIDNTGIHSWGPGSGAVDTTLFRATNNPPSGTAIGLQTNNPFVVNDPNGFKVIQIANSAAFTTWLLNTDTQPAFKIFAQGAIVWGAGGASAPDLELARLVNSPSGTGSFLEMILGQGFGYGSGAGGTATAAALTVTINKPNGVAIYTGQSNTASVPKAFTVSNTVVGFTDHVIVTLNNQTTAAGIWLLSASVTGGSISIIAFSTTANTAVTYAFNFCVIKGSNS